jgi:hypothetical protein
MIVMTGGSQCWDEQRLASTKTERGTTVGEDSVSKREMIMEMEVINDDDG